MATTTLGALPLVGRKRKTEEPRVSPAERIQRRGTLTLVGTPAKIRVVPRQREIDSEALRDYLLRPNALVSARLIDADGKNVCPEMEGVGYTKDDAIDELIQHAKYRMSNTDSEKALAVINRVKAERLKKAA